MPITYSGSSAVAGGGRFSGGSRGGYTSQNDAGAQRRREANQARVGADVGGFQSRIANQIGGITEKRDKANLQRQFESDYRRAQNANQNRAAAISGGYRRQGEALQSGYEQAGLTSTAAFDEILGVLDTDTGQRRADVVSQYNRDIAGANKNSDRVSRSGINSDAKRARSQAG